MADSGARKPQSLLPPGAASSRAAVKKAPAKDKEKDKDKDSERGKSKEVEEPKERPSREAPMIDTPEVAERALTTQTYSRKGVLYKPGGEITRA
jgi:hypothetical protein